MKTSKLKIVGITVGMALMTAGSAWGSELIGGYLNSKTRDAAMAIQSGRQRIQIINTAKRLQWGGAQYGSGKLFVVDSFNRISESRFTFRDRLGVVIAVPQGAYDKVVVLNRYGAIAWAAGLDDSEIRQFIPRELQAEGSAIANAQETPLFGAIRYSSHVLREMDADADTMADMFLTSVRWMAGNGVEKLLRTFMEKNGANPLNGISSVAQGGDGNGGDGLVAQGGDGNGGDGLIAQGGDGNGGDGLVNDLAIQFGQQTWEKTPHVRGLNAVSVGKVIILQ